MRYVDVGKGKCRAAVVDGDGVLIKEFSFFNEFSGIEGFVQQLSDGDSVVMESTGNLWVNLYEAVEGRGVKVVLANPLKMRAIASAKIRNDKVDARVLRAHVDKSFRAQGPEGLKRLYAHKASAERAISRLKQHLILENHKVRGLRNILIHALLCISTMLLIALPAIKLGKPDKIRAIRSLT